MNQIRKRLTYANVMSSIAVFFVLGGATAFAATKIGSNEIKANSILTGKIAKEAVASGKIKKNAITESRIADGAVTTNKIADNAVTTAKIANDAVTGDKVKESSLSEVPSAANAQKLGGQSASSFVARNALLWAVVREDGTLTAGSGAVAATRTSSGRYTVTFDRTVTSCISQGGSTDVTGGEPPSGNGSRIVSTDNRVQETANASKINVTTTSPAGVQEDPEVGDGFTLTVYC